MNAMQLGQKNALPVEAESPSEDRDHKARRDDAPTLVAGRGLVGSCVLDFQPAPHSVAYAIPASCRHPRLSWLLKTSMAGTSSAKTRSALLPGHHGNEYQGGQRNASTFAEAS